MKTMTCREMGGTCDMPIAGETAQEMMDKGAKHLMEAQDEGHKKTMAMMEEMKNNPEEGKKWNEEFTAKFNAL